MSLETKVGYHPFLYHYPYTRYNSENRGSYKYKICEWEDVKEGDEILVVGEGFHYGYAGKWYVEMTEKEWEDDSSMLRNRPYKMMDEWVPAYDAMQHIKHLTKLYIRCLEYFGFDDADKYDIATELEVAMDANQDLFPYLQCILASL
jgi:hypothetical protein